MLCVMPCLLSRAGRKLAARARVGYGCGRACPRVALGIGHGVGWPWVTGAVVVWYRAVTLGRAATWMFTATLSSPGRLQLWCGRVRRRGQRGAQSTARGFGNHALHRRVAHHVPPAQRPRPGERGRCLAHTHRWPRHRGKVLGARSFAPGGVEAGGCGWPVRLCQRWRWSSGAAVTWGTVPWHPKPCWPWPFGFWGPADFRDQHPVLLLVGRVPCLWDASCPCLVVPCRWQNRVGKRGPGVEAQSALLGSLRVPGSPGVPCSGEPLGTRRSRSAGLPAPSSGTWGRAAGWGRDTLSPVSPPPLLLLLGNFDLTPSLPLLFREHPREALGIYPGCFTGRGGGDAWRAAGWETKGKKCFFQKTSFCRTRGGVCVCVCGRCPRGTWGLPSPVCALDRWALGKGSGRLWSLGTGVGSDSLAPGWGTPPWGTPLPWSRSELGVGRGRRLV